MSIMVYNSLDKRPVPQEEKNSGEILVETAGYIPADKQIEAFLDAGQRLNAARAEMYDFPDGKDDGSYFDPTRTTGFDLADASRIGRQTDAKLREQKEEADRQIALEKEKKRLADEADAAELAERRKADKAPQ